MKAMWLVMLAVAATIGTPAPSRAQSAPALPFRGVPSGTASDTPLALSLADAVRRGLEHNLTIILEEQRLRGTESTRLGALSQLLPQVNGSVRQTRQVISTAAFGFTLPDIPTVIGPFGVFDSRISLSTPLFDARAIGGLRSTQATARAGEADLQDVRETVVLAIGTLYLQTEADAARVESARAQVATAEALVRLAEDQRTAGLIAGIDVVRQQVQLQSARARQIAAENAFEKRKLLLSRAIGLPPGQTYTLSDRSTFTPAPAATLDEAVAEAERYRPDLKAARARVEAARAARGAEAAGALPTVHLDADIGAMGSSTSDLDRTYAIAAGVRVPIFDGGERRARVQRATADLAAREAELADLMSGVRYDVESALLDIKAADAGVTVADQARGLSLQELDQAEDRFRAGVSSTLELVQAQEAVANATEQYIASVYTHAIAKAAFARAVGHVEDRFVALVGGQP